MDIAPSCSSGHVLYKSQLAEYRIGSAVAFPAASSTASLIGRSWLHLGGAERVEQVPAYPLDVAGRGGGERREALVGEHGELAAPVGGAVLAAHPAGSSSRATACDRRLREEPHASASSLIRSVRSGASESRTRIS